MVSAGDLTSSSQARPARLQDASACAAIYAPYVRDSVITFETEVPGEQEMAARIVAARQAHEWLVLDVSGVIVGYAYAHELNPRAAYRWSVETSVYMAADRRRSGGGSILYGELLGRLTERGYRRAFAGITQPNEASNAFHRAFGFEHAGLYRRVGWKMNAWHDVAWMQLDLQGLDEETAPPEEIT
ncbi:GNAT family N-acetyltransferase [Mycobacterium spongiae]|uniref:GNAT family N-acetyltransferase n=2 Tax=Mycobacterium spongiae TaxID=886343 RepID=A0A975K229_9MYCO|nr:GNAT family N-acetyltransferase [Mycobacterium spongiae]